MERTFVMIKPDGVKKRIMGEIISRFEKRGLYLVKIGAVVPTDEILKKHYAEHIERPFYNSLVSYMKSGMAIPMIWEGENSVKVARDLMGATCPLRATPGTIRADYGISLARNVIHGADSVEAAAREIEIWFGNNIEPISHFDKDYYYE